MTRKQNTHSAAKKMVRRPREIYAHRTKIKFAECDDHEQWPVNIFWGLNQNSRTHLCIQDIKRLHSFLGKVIEWKESKERS